MEHSRQNKLLMIIALVFGIASLSVGFAAFATTLNISSSASVSPSSDTFSVKFSTNQNSLVVGAVVPSSNAYNLTTTNGTIDNSTNPTIKGLSATFTSPGQYVEYVFYARNEGEYTAYLNNINFIGNKSCTAETGTTDSLVASACEDINISATIGTTTYTETTPITSHTLATKTGEQIKIRLEYASNGTSVDGSFTITFPSIALVYSTIDDSSIEPNIPQSKVCTYVDSEDDTGSAIGTIDLSDEVTCGTESFYVMYTDDNTVTMLAKYNLYIGGEYNSSWKAYGDEATGIQDSEMIGYGTTPVKGATKFTDTNYWASIGRSYPSYVYNGNSLLYNYVENYKTYLSTLGVTLKEARLITKDELDELGCSIDDRSCDAAPSWVYATSYWVGTAYSDYYVGGVSSDGGFGYTDYDYDKGTGCRPVIVISKSEF